MDLLARLTRALSEDYRGGRFKSATDGNTRVQAKKGPEDAEAHADAPQLYRNKDKKKKRKGLMDRLNSRVAASQQ